MCFWMFECEWFVNWIIVMALAALTTTADHTDCLAWMQSHAIIVCGSDMLSVAFGCVLQPLTKRLSPQPTPARFTLGIPRRLLDAHLLGGWGIGVIQHLPWSKNLYPFIHSTLGQYMLWRNAAGGFFGHIITFYLLNMLTVKNNNITHKCSEHRRTGCHNQSPSTVHHYIFLIPLWSIFSVPINTKFPLPSSSD